MKRHTWLLLANDAPGVLQRIAGLVGRRGYNIDSLTVGASEREGISRMTLVTTCEEERAGQLVKQLCKLVDVLDIRPLHPAPYVARELMLIKLTMTPDTRAELMSLADAFRCAVVDIDSDSAIIQVVGDTDKNDAFLRLVQPYGIRELARTGETAMNRGGAFAGG